MTLFQSTSSLRQLLPTLPKCGQCGLYKKCITPKMRPSGSGKVSILFVGEAPGENEDRVGRQFVGDSGSLLRKTLRGLGVELDDCLVTNAVICRPPGNQMKPIFIESCRPNLLNTVGRTKPTVIVPLGGSAVESLMGAEFIDADVGSISRWVGWKIPSRVHNAWVCPTYHPSFLMRSKEDPVLMRLFRQHLRAAIGMADVEVKPKYADKLDTPIEIITDPRMTRLKLREFASYRGLASMDYETTGLKPERPEQHIYSVGFCTGDVAWAGRYDESCRDELRRVLMERRIRKIAANLKYEDRWSIVKADTPVMGWDWDTMLAAHIMDNRKKICSLKFQSFIHFGIANYESGVSPYLKAEHANGINRIHEAPVKDTLKYNGQDAVYEYWLSVIQKEAMGYECR